MTFINRFVLFLVLGLAGLAWGASIAREKTTRLWFEKDLDLRVQLAVNGARRSLVHALQESDQPRPRPLLERQWSTLHDGQVQPQG